MREKGFGFLECRVPWFNVAVAAASSFREPAAVGEAMVAAVERATARATVKYGEGSFRR